VNICGAVTPHYDKLARSDGNGEGRKENASGLGASGGMGKKMDVKAKKGADLEVDEKAPRAIRLTMMATATKRKPRQNLNA